MSEEKKRIGRPPRLQLYVEPVRSAILSGASIKEICSNLGIGYNSVANIIVKLGFKRMFLTPDERLVIISMRLACSSKEDGK